MVKLNFVARVFAVCALVWNTAAICGQDYPNKPIRLVASAAGGGNDLIARLIADGLTSSMDQQVVIENRAGGSGIIAAQIVAKASADGYTLFNVANNLWLLPLMQETPYDPVKDFAPITLAVRSPTILVVHPSSPVKSVKDLIAAAKAKPGELNYGSSATGGSAHLSAELFKAMTNVNIVRVSYKGNALAVNDLIGGHVQLMFSNGAGVMPHVKTGRLRALAVTSAQPTALLPRLPTVAGSGLPGYEAEAVFGIFAPAKTPAPIVNRLNQETVRVLNRADVKEKFLAVGVETVGSSPQELAAKIKSEMVRMGKVITDAGIRSE